MALAANVLAALILERPGDTKNFSNSEALSEVAALIVGQPPTITH
jgi:hypothetical protein